MIQVTADVILVSPLQHIHNGDEMFWYETTLLMANATMSNYELKNANKRARGIITHALEVFTQVAETRPNKHSITGFILASLEAK